MKNCGGIFVKKAYTMANIKKRRKTMIKISHAASRRSQSQNCCCAPKHVQLTFKPSNGTVHNVKVIQSRLFITTENCHEIVRSINRQSW